MTLLSDIESRFTTVARVTITDLEAASKSEIGQALEDAARKILPLIPEGREAALVVTKLQEVEAWAHRALAAASPVVADVAAVASTVGTGALPAGDTTGPTLAVPVAGAIAPDLATGPTAGAPLPPTAGATPT
jgi:hypothetical protein